MKYPIGIQDFRKIREEDFVYIDKTEQIFRVLQNGQYFFLSRPRRFGKSLLLSTLKELYSGQKALFEGLWIEDQWDWDDTHPVIWLKFSSQGTDTLGLEKAIHHMLEEVALGLGVRLPETSYDQKFKSLIQQTGQEKKVVLLVDEYDKPIIDYLDDLEQAEANRAVLKNFYSVIKDSDPYIELVFITGVSAFSKVSIFSELNNLENLTLSRFAYTLLGITQKEIERFFPEQLKKADQEKMKTWYNGYSWGGEERLYNPFSLFRFFKEEHSFQNFWFETGTPTFLIKEMRKHRYYDVEQAEASPEQLTNFHADALDPISVLFQTGYLTIDHFDETYQQYILRYPNQEVRFSMQQHLLLVYQEKYPGNALAPVVAIAKALAVGDIEQVVTTLNAAFASIPYDLWQKENEHFYHALVHLIFSLLGVYIRTEVHTARGRCDALVENERYIYAFEFKLDGSAEAALQQIQEKGYLAPYQGSPKEKVAVGINFSTEQKAVEEWKVGSKN
ncbi:MAG: AAA family ATPase [Saprospiraceae bacterium]